MKLLITLIFMTFILINNVYSIKNQIVVPSINLESSSGSKSSSYGSESSSSGSYSTTSNFKYIKLLIYQNQDCTGEVIEGSFSLANACPNTESMQICSESGDSIEWLFYGGPHCTGFITGSLTQTTNQCTNGMKYFCVEELDIPFVNSILFYFTNGTCLDIDSPTWQNSITDYDYTIMNICTPDFHNAYSYNCNSTNVIRSIYNETNSCDTLIGTEVDIIPTCNAESDAFYASCNHEIN